MQIEVNLHSHPISTTFDRQALVVLRDRFPETVILDKRNLPHQL